MTLMKLPSPVAPTTTAGTPSPEVAALLERLRAAESALAAEKARADAAASAKTPRGYSMKASEKGAISIYGVSTKFPVTLYAPHLVGIVLDLILTDKGVAFLRENADRLSVKVDGAGAAGTPASRAEVNRLADRLAETVARLK